MTTEEAKLVQGYIDKKMSEIDESLKGYVSGEVEKWRAFYLDTLQTDVMKDYKEWIEGRMATWVNDMVTSTKADVAQKQADFLANDVTERMQQYFAAAFDDVRKEIAAEYLERGEDLKEFKESLSAAIEKKFNSIFDSYTDEEKQLVTFEKRYMQTVTGQQMLPQWVFRQFLREFSTDGVDEELATQIQSIIK